MLQYEDTMKRGLQIGIMLALIATVGCGGGSSHESVMKETVGVLNDLSDVLEKSKTADDAKPKIETLSTKFKDLKTRAKSLGEPSKAEGEALMKKYQPELKKAMDRYLQAAVGFAQRDPTGFPKIQAALESFKD